VDFRIARGLLERAIYREFFAARLTVFDPIEKFNSAAVAARLDVQNLIHEIGLIDEVDLKDASPEIELEMAGANAEANNVVAEETNKREVTLVPGLPTGSESAHPGLGRSANARWRVCTRTSSVPVKNVARS
jgi:hypothetical protein